MKTLLSLKRFVSLHPRVDWLVLLVGLGVFAWIALANISAASIWFDEAFSAYITQFSFLDIARYTATDVHPPLYYWALKSWEMLFGTSELALRSMSVFFAGIAIIFSYLLTRRWFGRKAALLAVLFLVLSPMLIRYSQEARMYTMATAIVMAATYVLAIASESKRKLPWVVYGILVAAGMWTHYFTALAWLAHWVWRVVVTWQKGLRNKEFFKRFFTKPWIGAHVIAIGLYVPWLPFMYTQLSQVQSTGFWISPVTMDTPVNYLTNLFYYLEHSQVRGWWVVLLMAVIITLCVLTFRTYKSSSKRDRQKFALIAALAFVPVLLLILASMPPLKPSFVERYLVPAVAAFALFSAVVVAVGLRKQRKIWTVAVAGVISALMVFGITNVYYYTNYNKNASADIQTKALMQQVKEQAKPGEPIIANSPWLFYEAIFYAEDEHPVYFIDANTEYLYGSLDMLKNESQHKIMDIESFTEEHPVFWYIGITNDSYVTPYDESWERLGTISVFSTLNDRSDHRATQYTTASLE